MPVISIGDMAAIQNSLVSSSEFRPQVNALNVKRQTSEKLRAGIVIREVVEQQQGWATIEKGYDRAGRYTDRLSRLFMREQRDRLGNDTDDRERECPKYREERQEMPRVTQKQPQAYATLSSKQLKTTAGDISQTKQQAQASEKPLTIQTLLFGRRFQSCTCRQTGGKSTDE